MTVRDWHCPPWCIVLDRHDDESERRAYEGGAVHWSQHLRGAGGIDVRVATVTDAEGLTVPSSPVIHVGDVTVSAAEARTLALDLLRAAALADIADDLAVRA